MKKKGEPGKFIPYDQLVEMLKPEYYGSLDLLSYELFYNDYSLRSAMRNGQLKFHIVNDRTTFFKREDILEYWRNHRSTPYEEASCKVTVKMRPTEQHILDEIVSHACNKVDSRFTRDDLVRNFIRYLKEKVLTGNIKFENNVLFAVNN
jgi:hypothetical protein